MTLLMAMLLMGAFLILKGSWLLKTSPEVGARVQSLLRSNLFTWLTFGTGCLWFLYLITQLGESDFGEYKRLLFVIFTITSIGAFFYTPDFLSVRGLAILTLLIARKFLDAAYLQMPQTRLLLVSIVYFYIVGALYFGTFPFQFRDALNWFFKSSLRLKCLGSFFLLYGMILVFFGIKG